MTEIDFDPLPAPVTREAMDVMQERAGISGRIILTPMCHPYALVQMYYFDGCIESYCGDCGELTSVFDLRTSFDLKKGKE